MNNRFDKMQLSSSEMTKSQSYYKPSLGYPIGFAASTSKTLDQQNNEITRGMASQQSMEEPKKISNPIKKMNALRLENEKSQGYDKHGFQTDFAESFSNQRKPKKDIMNKGMSMQQLTEQRIPNMNNRFDKMQLSSSEMTKSQSYYKPSLGYPIGFAASTSKTLDQQNNEITRGMASQQSMEEPKKMPNPINELRKKMNALRLENEKSQGYDKHGFQTDFAESISNQRTPKKDIMNKGMSMQQLAEQRIPTINNEYHKKLFGNFENVKSRSKPSSSFGLQTDLAEPISVNVSKKPDQQMSRGMIIQQLAAELESKRKLNMPNERPNTKLRGTETATYQSYSEAESGLDVRAQNKMMDFSNASIERHFKKLQEIRKKEIDEENKILWASNFHLN